MLVGVIRPEYQAASEFVLDTKRQDLTSWIDKRVGIERQEVKVETMLLELLPVKSPTSGPDRDITLRQLARGYNMRVNVDRNARQTSREAGLSRICRVCC